MVSTVASNPVKRRSLGWSLEPGEPQPRMTSGGVAAGAVLKCVKVDGGGTGLQSV